MNVNRKFDYKHQHDLAFNINLLANNIIREKKKYVDMAITKEEI